MTVDDETGSVGLREMPGGFRIRWDAGLASRWRASGEWLDTTLAALTRDLVTREPSRVLLIENDVEYTAEGLYDEALRLASAFVRRGLCPGDVISYQIPNWYEGCVINVAAALAGLIVNPLVPIYRERELRFMMADVGTKLVFVPQSFRNTDYAAMHVRLNADRAVPVDVIVLRGKAEGAEVYATLLAEGRAEDPLPFVDPDSIYVVMHTSGTTGRPKCVVHSHNTFLVQGKAHVLALRTRDDEVNLVATPISHIAGIIVANLTPVIGGAKVVLMETWSPDEAVKLVGRYQANSCGGATPFLKGLLEAAKAAGTHLPSLTKAACGGAAVPPELIYEAHDWFPNVLAYRVYGCTEVPTITIGIASRDDIDHGANTDGIIRNSEIKIVDAVTGTALPREEEGEILVRGPNMMLGYLRPEDNEPAFDDEGFFRTGDLGRVIDDKYLLITGRKKDLIIRNGENLSPKEIEDALFTHPGIDNVAVVGMPSAKTGEAVCAFVVGRSGRAVDLAEVARHLIGLGFAKQKIPERVVMVAELPTSPQGKILKFELRERAKQLTSEDDAQLVV